MEEGEVFTIGNVIITNPALGYDFCRKAISEYINKENRDKKMKIYTADRETGTFIEEFATVEAARLAIEVYEAEDKKDGTFEPDFYDVVNENHETING